MGTTLGFMPDTPAAAEAPRRSHSSTTPRWMWVVLMFLTSIIVGLVVGILSYVIEPSVPQAIGTGAGAVVPVFLLQLAIAHYADGGRA